MSGRYWTFMMTFVALAVNARLAPAQDAPEAKSTRSAESPKSSEKSPDGKNTKPIKPRIQLATFGGGCFWCTDAVFRQIPGVKSVVSGYSGGTVAFPTYEQVSTGMTGHAEVIQIAFDSSVVSYEKLLEIFWKTHDPTTPNAQGPDMGTQYRSIILYHDPEQKEVAEQVYQHLKARKVFRGKVVTQLVPFQAFFPAEAYHQDYYANHPFDSYSMVYIVPKLDKLRALERSAKKASNPKPPPRSSQPRRTGAR